MSRIQVVSQVGLVALGFDEPRLSVDIDMRPSGSVSDWLQRRGRPARAYPAKAGAREYQDQAIAAFREALRAKQNPLYVLPCGGGKSYIACLMAAAAAAKGRGIGFITVRRVLVADISKRLRGFGVPHGVIMPGYADTADRTKVASVHTLAERGLTLDVDALFVDEAHLYLSGAFRAVLDRHAHIPRVCLTATPWRADGLGLGRIADKMILGPSMEELINMGHLVPTRVFSRRVPDRSGLTVNDSGEFNERENAALMGRPAIVGDCVKEWLYRAKGRPTIVHAVNVKHSQAIVARFQAAGVNAVHIDATTPDKQREDAFEEMCDGAAAKDHSLLIDLAGNVCQFGFPEDSREWTLADVDPRERKQAGLSVRRCEKCWFVFRAHTAVCPECGNQYVPTQRQIKEKKEELVELKRKAKEQKREEIRTKATDEEKNRIFAGIVMGNRHKQNCKDGYFYHLYHAKTGHWPTREMMELCRRLREQKS